jgi:TorA maturation chaperone TorD
MLCPFFGSPFEPSTQSEGLTQYAEREDELGWTSRWEWQVTQLSQHLTLSLTRKSLKESAESYMAIGYMYFNNVYMSVSS